MYEKALRKFNDAVKICGYNSELVYNIALCHYELEEYEESVKKLELVIRKAYEKYPQLKHNKGESMFDGNKAKTSQVLRETAIVEALNLKAGILYNQRKI